MSLLKFFQKQIPVSDAEEAPASTAGESSSLVSLEESDKPSDSESVDDIDESRSVDESCIPPAAKRVPLTLCDDVASYIGASIPADSKYQLLTNHFKPGVDYKFPKSVSGRAFQYRWLQLYPWLVYSKQENGGYCLPCVLFASCGYHRSDPGILVRRPLISFPKALELFHKHKAKDYHKTAVVRADEFLQVMKNQQPSIRHRINQALADTISSNRLKLASIVKTILLCGRQNIALRGHRDNATDLERDTSENYGNFWALLKFRIEAGDEILGEHLATAPRNATYTSSNIQNQLIDILGGHIREKILNKVKAAQWFTVISDEVTDLSNKEQLSIVLRYVDPDTLLVREDLVSFLECDTGITGRCLADKIIHSLQSFGLDLSKLRGQAYDGAGNMAGSVRGTAALITAQYPLALYLHCASHSLNLAVVKSLQVTSIRNMMGVVDRVSVFFGAHPKRQRALEKAITDNQPDSTVSKLKDLCRTRWIQRIDALNIFQHLYPSIVACMESICSDGSGLWSSDSLTDARSLQLAITTTDFICALVITNSCLKYLQALTSNLQAEAKDIIEAVKEINSVKAALQNARDKIDTYHCQCFDTVKEICNGIGMEASLPRRCGRQIYRSNVPADTPSDYYRRCISVPLLDHLLLEMESRFSIHQQTALLGLSLIPSILVDPSTDADECNTKICQLADMYQQDLPSHDCIGSELHCWKMKWQKQFSEHGQISLPSTPTTTLRHSSSMYPNVRALVNILCTLPVTSCSAERSFSALKRIKNALRSSMITERLTGLTLLHLHRDISVDIPEVIDQFARRHPRRLQMSNILAD